MIASRNRLIAIVAAALVACHAAAAIAQTCTEDQIATAVDKAGAALRDITRMNQPKLDERIRALGQLNRWPPAEATEKALDLLADERAAQLDIIANELLSKVDQLGNIPPRTAVDCSRLQELEAASLELQAAVKAKSAHMLVRADSLLAGATAPVVAAKPLQPAPVTPAQAPPKAAPPPAPKTWSTTTSVEPQPIPPMPQAIPAPVPPVPAPPPRDDSTFTIDEVAAASVGLFGKVTAGLGSVVEYAFRKNGRPTGYILGEELSGAWLAGLRYGKGMLHLRDGRKTTVYWHGPSLGLDFGGQGTNVMFLVYGLAEPEALFSTYTTLEGSAFLASGLGITLMTNGTTQLAPIRSGIGVRFGASVGYVRFTRRQTWNPF